jgi:hypothetical protein
MEDWRDEVGDMGELSEAEMVSRWYPGGERPRTAAPIFVPICATSPGREAAPEGGSFAGPLRLQLHCATQGASIAWTTEAGEDPHWQLYTEPIPLPTGTTAVRARAIRVGYKESREVAGAFTVE